MSFIVNPLASVSPATVGGTGTTAKIFQIASPPFTPAGVGPSGAVTLGAPGSGRLDGKKFTVRASGNAFVHGTTPTIQIQILAANPGGNNVVLAQSTAQTVTTNANYPWYIEADLQGTTLSGILQGAFDAVINNAADKRATLTNTLTGVNFGSASQQYNNTTGVLSVAGNTADEPSINFQVALLFSVSDALNLGTLSEFALIRDNG
jgi:hypothetical protein